MPTISKNDIISAVKNPKLIFDPFILGKKVEIPEHEGKGYGGGFSQVFPLVIDGEKWAYKIWDKDIENNEDRYRLINTHLNEKKLSYFVDFEYVKNGLLVKDTFLDCCRMRWVNGLKLTEYISKNLHNKNVLLRLADDFSKMSQELNANHISHGDLQHENIFVEENGKIVLIDYDSLCVPALENQYDFCRGRRGYQHPWRTISRQNTTSLKIDHFSELVIYLTICAVAENHLLWDQYDVVEAERMLFTQDDFLDFNSSNVRKDLRLLSKSVQSLTNKLESYLLAHSNLTPFYSQ